MQPFTPPFYMTDPAAINEEGAAQAAAEMLLSPVRIHMRGPERPSSNS